MFFTINDDIDTRETKEKTGTDSLDSLYNESNQKNNRKRYKVCYEFCRQNELI